MKYFVFNSFQRAGNRWYYLAKVVSVDGNLNHTNITPRVAEKLGKEITKKWFISYPFWESLFDAIRNVLMDEWVKVDQIVYI